MHGYRASKTVLLRVISMHFVEIAIILYLSVKYKNSHVPAPHHHSFAIACSFRSKNLGEGAVTHTNTPFIIITSCLWWKHILHTKGLIFKVYRIHIIPTIIYKVERKRLLNKLRISSTNIGLAGEIIIHPRHYTSNEYINTIINRDSMKINK